MAAKKYLSVELDEDAIRCVLVEASNIGTPGAESYSLLDFRIIQIKNVDEFGLSPEELAKPGNIYENYLISELKKLKAAIPIKDYKLLLLIRDKRPKFGFFSIPGNLKHIAKNRINELGQENVQSISTGDAEEQYFGYLPFLVSKNEEGEDLNHFLYFSTTRTTAQQEFTLYEKAGFNVDGAYFPNLAFYALYRFNELPPGKMNLNEKTPYLCAVLGIGAKTSQVHLLYKDSMVFTRPFDFGTESLAQKQEMQEEIKEEVAAGGIGMRATPGVAPEVPEDEVRANKFLARVNISLDYMKRTYRHFQSDRVIYFGAGLSQTNFEKYIMDCIKPVEGCQNYNPLQNLENKLLSSDTELTGDDVSSLCNAIGTVILHQDPNAQCANVYPMYYKEVWARRLKMLGPLALLAVLIVACVVLFGAFQVANSQLLSKIKEQSRELRNKKMLFEGLSTPKKEVDPETGEEKEVSGSIGDEHKKYSDAKKLLYNNFIKKLSTSVKKLTYLKPTPILMDVIQSQPEGCYFENLFLARKPFTVESLKKEKKQFAALPFSSSTELKEPFYLALKGYAAKKSTVMELLSYFSRSKTFSNVEIAELQMLKGKELDKVKENLKKVFDLKGKKSKYGVSFILFSNVKSSTISSVFTPKKKKKKKKGKKSHG
ncbi:hypothetical protein ACFL35_11105 [Candidatus Riflebacteria bacterium]